MSETTMLGKVKLALRITHTLLDTDITETIATARAELIRSGVGETLAESTNDLVEMAIKTYCLYVYANNEKMAENYFKSWEYQVDSLRKSTIEVAEEE